MAFLRNVKNGLHRVIARGGYEVRHLWKSEDDAFEAFLRERGPLPTRIPEKAYSIWQAVRWASEAGVAGDFVECGVETGATCVTASLAMQHLGDVRKIWLYDTFAGMPEPGPHDVNRDGRAARPIYESRRRGDHTDWCYTPLDQVRRRMADAGHPADRLEFVQGLVEDTIPGRVPEQIAVLRLDTDFYESTKHELEHLWPRLLPGGVLYIDDYSSWRGARKAADEYFATPPPRPLLFRHGYGAAIASE